MTVQGLASTLLFVALCALLLAASIGVGLLIGAVLLLAVLGLTA